MANMRKKNQLLNMMYPAAYWGIPGAGECRDQQGNCNRFHWKQVGNDSGRPGVASLIVGKTKEIMEFLDRLSYGDNDPAEVSRTREE